MSEDAPKISVLVPTHGRPNYLRFMLEQFQAQTYPNKEAVVVLDSFDRPLPPYSPEILQNVRLVTFQARRCLWEKRNAAIPQCEGDIVVIWDDDDWSAPTRLADQVAPILEGKAAWSVYPHNYILQLMPGKANWFQIDADAAQVVEGGYNDGTLMFRKEVWQKSGGFGNQQIGEIHMMLEEAKKCGFHPAILPNPNQFVYVRHAGSLMGAGFMLQCCREIPSRPDFFSLKDELRYRQCFSQDC